MIRYGENDDYDLGYDEGYKIGLGARTVHQTMWDTLSMDIWSVLNVSDSTFKDVDSSALKILYETMSNLEKQHEN